jgi:CheY-like chemotaxis protein
MSQVLIVDDSAPLRAIAKRVLREADLSFDGVLEADDGSAALACLSEHADVELVLFDLDLPDAIEFIRDVRRDPTRQDLPIVLVSSGRSLPARALSAGANACLARPFTAAGARAALEPLLSIRARGA